MSKCFFTSLCAGLIFVWAAPVAAQPAKLCAPDAKGVPTRRGPPIWWGTSSDDVVVDPQPSDPRWQGATRITRGDGAHEEVSLRALSHTEDGQQYLYLEWAAHPTHAGTDDDRGTIYLGLSAGSGSTNTFVVQFDVGAATASAPTELSGYKLYAEPTDGELKKVSTDLAWLENTADVQDDEPTNPDAAKGWFLRARIPIKDASTTGYDDALPVGTEFYLWTQWSLPRVADDDRVYAYPHGLPEATEVPGPTEDIPPTLQPPPIGQWKPAVFGTSDPECASGGVRLDRLQVGVAPNGQEGTAVLSHKIEAGAVNSLVARPENTGTEPISEKGIEATFRISDWGSSSEWTPIGTGLLSESLEPKGTDPSDPFDGMAPISIQWEPSTDYLDDSKDHQCMLVELRGSGGPELPPTGAEPGSNKVTFLNESVYRNMDFVETNSVFSRKATISAKGLPAIDGASDREIYLYLETRNMPQKVDESKWHHRKRFIDYHLDRIRGDDPGRSPYGKEQPGDYEALDDLMPTYIVHVYHDTGRTVRRNGKERRVLKSQPSFGYYVDHNDPLVGWSVALDGAEYLGDNWYRIRVEDEGTHVVRTRVQARETSAEKPIQAVADWPNHDPCIDGGPCPDSGDSPWWQRYWWLWILAIIVIIVFVKRRSSS